MGALQTGTGCRGSASPGRGSAATHRPGAPRARIRGGRTGRRRRPSRHGHGTGHGIPHPGV